MDINLMVLNVGNSRLALGVFVSGNLEYVTRISHEQRGDWAGKIAEAWKHIADKPNPAVAGISVNAPVAEPLELAIQQATGQKVQWIGRDIELPIKVLTTPPTDTGADRVINIAAAFEQMGKACVVVDAGTAITVDVCNDQGEFLGGAIAPGVNTMLDSLHARTAKLPRINFAKPEGAIGQSTQQAILQGVYHGVRGMVKELTENYAVSLGFWPDIIATGGDAQVLFEGWELVHAIAPDLTLYGIALAFTNHQIKQDE